GEIPLVACKIFDRSGDGAVTVDEILSAVPAILDGCAAAIPLPQGTAALYDTVVSSDAGPVSVLGTRNTYLELEFLNIDVGPNERLSLQISNAQDGPRLDGNLWFSDYGCSASGTVQRSDDAGHEHIEGTVMVMGGCLFQRASFVMQRDLRARPAPFAGTYR